MTLRLGYVVSGFPFLRDCFLRQNCLGPPGAEAEIFAALATSLNASLHFAQSPSFEHLEASMAAGSIDASLNSLHELPRRTLAFGFTSPVKHLRQGFVFNHKSLQPSSQGSWIAHVTAMIVFDAVTAPSLIAALLLCSFLAGRAFPAALWRLGGTAFGHFQATSLPLSPLGIAAFLVFASLCGHMWSAKFKGDVIGVKFRPPFSSFTELGAAYPHSGLRLASFLGSFLDFVAAEARLGPWRSDFLLLRNPRALAARICADPTLVGFANIGPSSPLVAPVGLPCALDLVPVAELLTRNDVYYFRRGWVHGRRLRRLLLGPFSQNNYQRLLYRKYILKPEKEREGGSAWRPSRLGALKGVALLSSLGGALASLAFCAEWAALD